MKRAILSDIHGNLPALEAVLAHAGQHEVLEYIFTGDMVGHGPNPESCIQHLKNKAIVGVKGNNDKALLMNNELDHFFSQNESSTSLNWSKMQLSNESIAWLKNNLADSALDVGQFLTIVHGTLMDPMGEYTYMYDNDSNIKMSFRNLKTPIGLFGHTHRPVIYTAIPKPSPFSFAFTKLIPQYDNSNGLGKYIYGYAQDLGMGVKLLACAGSIGQPRDGDWRASYVIVDDERQELQYYRLPYNLQKVFEDFEKIRARFPGQDTIINDCIERLRQGK